MDSDSVIRYITVASGTVAFAWGYPTVERNALKMDIDSVIWYFTVASGVVALVGGYFINYLRRRQKLLDWAMIYSSVASSGITVLCMIKQGYSAADFVMHCILIVITVVVGFSEEFDVLAKNISPGGLEDVKERQKFVSYSSSAQC
ncbi:hypothetical protein Ddc_05885 [Ditylenchus destructor]|nr:hypothetical protein Ddc_05885 [Ditylenchus destructor]